MAPVRYNNALSTSSQHFAREWEKLKEQHPALDSQGVHRIDIEGISIHERFASTAPIYESTRMWDALARILVVFKPCCAIYPEYDASGKLINILIAFNENPADKTVIENIWSKIKDITLSPQAERTQKQLSVLSDVLNLQEYKVIMNAGLLLEQLNISILNRHILFNSDKIPNNQVLKKYINILKSLKEYNDKIDYDRELYRSGEIRSDSDSSALRIQINELMKEPSILQMLNERQLSSKFKPHSEDKDIKDEELSVVFIKLQLLLYKFVDAISDQEEKKIAEELYENFAKGFIRAGQDIKKVSETLVLQDTEVNLEFVDNSDNVHAELAILIHRIIASGGVEKYVDSTALLDHHLGVSKLSCEECYSLFHALELVQYIRGGHGNCFHAIWTMPKIEAQYLDLAAKMREYLNNSTQSNDICIEGVKINDYCANISDDEEEAEVNKLLTTTTFENPFSYLIKMICKFFDIEILTTVSSDSGIEAFEGNTVVMGAAE